MEARRKKLQTEIGTLQGVFEGAATLEKLDRELAQLAEVLDAKVGDRVQIFFFAFRNYKWW